ncbi:Abi family protein [Amycolatopsis viridis]|uniref:Abi-like protein n=1 Tax=Amycolatopsis viridis TaxID=185678 RepID=A0ABX0SMP8_9PSEU|nr:Abi family protein [Amycolatopsis viridis]NIH77880.1 hypothetical protein [Amycolatopsis viridis]
MADYLVKCHHDRAAALDLYAWNSLAGSAYWETLGHLEIALRNVLASQLAARHQTKGRPGSWLDDPGQDLDATAREEIRKARQRVRRKGKHASEGQAISELTFGFWRYLLAKQYNTTLWPSLASGFPHAPSRARHTIEQPIKRLHQFRNRLAHHEPIWNKELTQRQQDIYDVLTYIDPNLHSWVAKRCRISAVLLTCPVPRPHP